MGLMVFYVLLMPFLHIASAFNWNNGTVLYWNLNESSGTNAQELFNSVNNLTHTNSPAVIPGVFSNARNYTNAGNTYSQSLSNIGLTTTDKSYCLWTRPIGTTARYLFAVSTTDVIYLSSSKFYIGEGITDTLIPYASGQLYYVCLTYESSGTKTKLYINGTNAFNGTISLSRADAKMVLGARQDLGAGTSYAGMIDEVSVFNRTLSPQEVSELYNNGIGIVPTVTVTPTVTLLSPANNSFLSSSSIDFSCSASVASNNLTLLIWNSTNNLIHSKLWTSYLCYQETANKTTSGDGSCGQLYTGSYLVDDTLHAGGDNWIDPTYFYDGNWLTSTNYILAGNTGYIYINYTKPNNQYLRGATWSIKDGSGSANVTILDSCFNYNPSMVLLRAHGTIGFSTAGWDCFNGTWNQIAGGGIASHDLYEEGIYWNISSTNFTVSFNDPNKYSWNCLANGTYYAQGNYSFTYGATVNSYNYTPTTFNNYYESFTINLTFPTANAPTYARLLYNNQEHNATIGIATNQVLNVSFFVPSAQGTYSFYWELTYPNGFKQNTTAFNQNVITTTPFVIDTACQAGTVQTFAFSCKDEETQAVLNDTINYNFAYGYGGALFTTNGTIKTNGTFIICSNSSIPSYRISYGELQYFDATHPNRKFYLFNGTTISNTTNPNNFTLYGLEQTSLTPFQLNIQSTSLQLYPGYYTSLLRWYPQFNEYRVVEMNKLDSNSNTVISLVQNTADYRVALYQTDGTLIKLFDPARLTCTTSPCAYSLLVPTTSGDLTAFQKIQNNLSWDQNNSRFIFIWNDPTQTTSAMNLSVWKQTGFGDQLICSAQASGFTGVLTCPVGSATGNLYAVAFRSASPQIPIASLIQTIADRIIGTRGGQTFVLFMSFLLGVVLMLIGAYASPVLALIFAIITLIPILFLGGISIALFFAFLVLAGIVYHFIKKT